MSARVGVVVLISLHSNKEAEFEEYERTVSVILRRHGGCIERRLRSASRDVHEVHWVSFPEAGSLDAYRADPEYRALENTRSSVIRETTVLTGIEAAPAGEDDSLRIVGLDHVYLSVTDMDRSEPFYDAVMELLGFRKGDKPIAGERHAHYFNPVLQIAIRPARSNEPFDAYRAGLHHLCLQAADERSVDEAHARLGRAGVVSTLPKKYPEYNPDYYATFLEDPDGIRLEIVARTPHREKVARRWSDFRVFLNPVADLAERER